jgi:hypothetical protein
MMKYDVWMKEFTSMGKMAMTFVMRTISNFCYTYILQWTVIHAPVPKNEEEKYTEKSLLYKGETNR